MILAAIVVLILLNIIVWRVELLKPGQQPNAKVKRSGLLLLLYLPLWVITNILFLAVSAPEFYSKSLFPHHHFNIAVIIWNMILAVLFALLHRPLLSLLGHYLLRNQQGYWALASAGFGIIAGLLQCLIVRTLISPGPKLLVVFCATSALVGYCVGYVRATRPRQPAI